MARLISSRSKWKGPYSKISGSIFKTLTKIHYAKQRSRTRGRRSLYRSIYRFQSPRSILAFLRLSRSRSSVILTRQIKLAKTIGIYNGRHFFGVNPTTDHRGHRLGEFNFTTRRGSNIHKNNTKTKKNKTKK